MIRTGDHRKNGIAVVLSEATIGRDRSSPADHNLFLNLDLPKYYLTPESRSNGNPNANQAEASCKSPSRPGPKSGAEAKSKIADETQAENPAVPRARRRADDSIDPGRKTRDPGWPDGAVCLYECA